MSPKFLPRLGVQSKVLLPVLGFLFLVPAVTVWMVSSRISDQMEAESQSTLLSARSIFEKLLEIREADLVNRYSIEAADANFRSVTALRDKPTMNHFLGEMLEKFQDDEVALLLDEQGTPFASARKFPGVNAADIADLSEPVVAGALGSDATTTYVTINDRVYLVAGTPVSLSGKGPPEWVLLVANRLGDLAMQEFRSLTNTEIVLFANGGRVAASTTTHAGGVESLSGEVSQPAAANELKSGVPAEMNGKHFLTLAGYHGSRDGTGGFNYTLLLSTEERYQALADTQRTLTIFGLIGILVSALVVAGLVRRTIRPLRELAEAAEAVGRGDFSHTLSIKTNDECGELAAAFNRMTTNLGSSRAELEKTVATLKTAQQQLVQSERLSAVGQFVAGVAHELNNPLTAVIGFSELIADLSKDEKLRPHLEMIAKSAHRCHKIVQNLLSFARQHPPERRLVRIDNVMNEVVEIMAYDLRTSNIELERDYASDVPEIMADPHQLQQVFVNILSNARQAILTFRQDGRIAITTRAEGDMLRIKIRDNGPGITPENLRKIFDPFFTTKPVGKGTGLGLSLSYGIISEHGGGITADSVVGEGTTFTIDLPMAAADARTSEKGDESGALPAGGGEGRRVLIVDDELWILELTSTVLENDGYDVVAVDSGAKAIDSVGRQDFDVILCDWKMPGMSGLQFYEHLLSDNPSLARRVLFMSGDVINDTFNDFLMRHGRSCLQKPFGAAKLVEAVSAVWSGN